MANEENVRKGTWNPIFHEFDYPEDEYEEPEQEVLPPVVAKVWDPIFKDWVYTHADGSVSAWGQISNEELQRIVVVFLYSNVMYDTPKEIRYTIG